MDARPRLAIVHPYWDLWEHTAGPTFRADRLTLAQDIARGLDDAFEVTVVADVASVGEGSELGARLADGSVDAILAVVTMAAPPTYLLAVLDAVPEIPVVIWAAHESGLVDGHFDHASITTGGATVGAPMVTNLLNRAGRPFQLLVGRVDHRDTQVEVRRALRLAGVVGGIRRARLGRIGRPLDGYAHVDLDATALRDAMGIEIVPVEPDEVVAAWREVGRDRVDRLEAEVRDGWQLAPDTTEGEALERSLRMALALEDVVERHGLAGGAFNCHVPQFRFGEEIGIAPCWGLGRLTTMGRPFTCTGDLVTAVAMLTTKRLGGAALYQEIEAIDYDSGEVVVANSGEHDLAWLAPGERPRLVRNGWFCGKDPICGLCAAFEPAPGPATLVGFTPHPDARGGFRYVAARGALTDRRFPETGTANGAFRFAEGGVEEAWARWARTGVNHHSSATPGDITPDLEIVASQLGVEALLV